MKLTMLLVWVTIQRKQSDVDSSQNYETLHAQISVCVQSGFSY